MDRYRTNLEKSKEQLMSALQSRETIMRGALARQLGQIVGEIILLDAGEHWTQQPTDTQTRIKIDGLDLSNKTIK